MKGFLLILVAFFGGVTRGNAVSCPVPNDPVNGFVTCPKGRNHFSVCIIKCNLGYELSGPSRTVCWCRGDACTWKGDEQTCKPIDCNMPFHDAGRVRLADLWPKGFAGVVELDAIPSLSEIRDGWSIVIVFDRPLGKNASISSWNTEMSARSYDGQTFTLVNEDHNVDLASYMQTNGDLDVLFVINNVDSTVPEAAYVGMYNTRISDATCVLAPKMPAILDLRDGSTQSPDSQPASVPERETYSGSKPETKPKVTPKIKPTTKQRPRKRGRGKKRPTTAPPTTKTTPATTKATTTKRVTFPPRTFPTTVKTTPETTPAPQATNPTGPTVPIPKTGRYCILQRGEDSFETKKWWLDRGSYYFSLAAVMDVTERLEDWTMVVVFDEAIDEVEIWNSRILDKSGDGLIWTFGPSVWNAGLNPGKTTIDFIAKKVESTQKPPVGQVFLCSNSFTSGDAMMTLPESSGSSRVRRAVRRPGGKRCNKKSPNGSPVSNAQQTTLSFKPNQDGTKYNYNEVLHMSILFYEAQRSGKLPPTNRVPWRGNSVLKDGCDAGVDVSGGFFDGASHIKFNFPMAFTLTTLAWGGIEFGDAYRDAGEYQHLVNIIKSPTQYFIKCHTAKFELIGQVGKAETENDNWGRPEEVSYARPTFKITANKPGTELAAETAAALAAASIFLKPSDAKLAAEALKHAKELYEFADKYRKSYHLSIPDAAPFYKSYSGYEDELVWAAAWLYRATNEARYLTAANKMYTKINGQNTVGDRYAWDNKLIGAQAVLAELTGDQIYTSPLTQYLDGLEIAPTTPKGMHYLDEWGPNRYTGGAAFMSALGAKLDLPGKQSYLDWATKQIGLILGDTGRSFVVGFGDNYPKKTQHRGSSCPPSPETCDWESFHLKGPNHYILYGALVGGTDEKGVFHDDRENAKENNVACDYNAGFQSAIAGLKHFAMKTRGKGYVASAGQEKATVKPQTKAPVTYPTPATRKTPRTTPKTTTPQPYVTQRTQATTRVPEKVRCARGSPNGKPVRGAKQTPLNFKANNDGTKHNYNEALHKSILFFEVQRAGRLPPENRIPWRGDSALKDGCDIGVDLSGGWYDAGDHVKFNFPMAFSLTTLAWGGIAFKDAYQDAGELQHMINAVKWPTEYFIKCHTSKNELVGQVGNGKIDHDAWGRPETMSMKRPTYKLTAKKPGSELAAETAAALAAASIFLKESHPQLASEALRHAKEIYEFADKYRGLYHVSIPDAKIFYESISGYDDELIWGAAWLYKATKDKKYLNKASTLYNKIQGKYVVETRYSWDRKLCGAQALLAELTGEAIYRDPFLSFLNNLPKAKKTPQGLHFITKWGSNRYAAGAAFMSAIGANLKPAPANKIAYQKWAQKQIGLMLGDGGRSFVVGYGNKFPTKPHHRSSTCPPYPQKCDWSNFNSPKKNFYTLYGALVGGPDAKGVYHDKRALYEETEVTCDYNACFQSAVAGVKKFAMESRGKARPTAETRPYVATQKSPATRQPGTASPKTSPKPDRPGAGGKGGQGKGKTQGSGGQKGKGSGTGKGGGMGKKGGAGGGGRGGGGGGGGKKAPCKPATSYRCKQLAKKQRQNRNRNT